MLKDGFLRFCDDPEIACCRGEAELGQLRQENIRLRAELLESQRRERAAVEDIYKMARLLDAMFGKRGERTIEQDGFYIYDSVDDSGLCRWRRHSDVITHWARIVPPKEGAEAALVKEEETP